MQLYEEGVSLTTKSPSKNKEYPYKEYSYM